MRSSPADTPPSPEAKDTHDMGHAYADLKGKKTLIVGEVGSGKTRYTRSLLEEAIEAEHELITVIDFAPALRNKDGADVGGRLFDGDSHMVRVLSSKLIKMPRITARTQEELIRFADYNRDITETLLQQFTGSSTSTLFVNDVHIHLQRGTLQTLWKAVRDVDTVIMNGYMGSTLKDLDTGVSRRERLLMVRLGAKVDQVIQL